MRLAAKWDGSWSLITPFTDLSKRSRVLLRDQPFEVVRMGQGDPLVLVPGLAGSWKLLMPLARRLVRHFEVISYGLRGERLGGPGSMPPAGCRGDIATHADDLGSLIQRLGLERPVVFGVSFGGAIALELAAEQPHRIGSLILHGADSRFRTSLGSSVARRVLERFPLPDDNRFVNQFFNLLHGTKPQPGPLVDFIERRIWETDQSVMAQRLAQLESFDVSDRLWRIDTPTLVLAGSKDVIVPAARQRVLAQSIAGARFESIEGAGHIGFLTHGQQVARLVRRHIRSAKTSV